MRVGNQSINRNKFMKAYISNKIGFKVRDTVYWNDPCQGFSSGYYKIVELYSDFCLISNNYTEAEVYYCELEKCNKKTANNKTLKLKRNRIKKRKTK